MFFRTGCQFGVPGGTYPPKKYPSASPPPRWTVVSELWYEVASNLNTFFLSWKQRTAAVFSKMYRVYSHLSERASKGRFVDLCWARPGTADISSKITSKGEKERARRKKGGGEKKKSNGCTFSFYNGYYDGFFWPKKWKLSCRQNHSFGLGPWFGYIEYILN